MLQRQFRGMSPMWREMEQLRREMDRLWGEVAAPFEAPALRGYPAMNVWMNENGAVVTTELPGVLSDNLDINVADNTLTVSGSRKPEELEEGATYHRRERAYGTFTRSFQLPFKVDPQKVEASLNNGILTITLPRAEEDKPKKIAVRVS
ncbi:MAG: Spore protein SP21 [Chloroflexi bacterium ADurb.Bin222]|nr:MAG: Spore protein SP21 [Chloroflexi bacterium ADurb.Bin222]